jgi:hypothetical protein
MNLLLGFGTIIHCLAIQCVVVNLTIRLLHTVEEKHLIGNSLFSNWALLISVLMVFLTTNLLQAAIWSGLFFALGEFEDFRTAFYHSLVNFTTLGYG